MSDEMILGVASRPRNLKARPVTTKEYETAVKQQAWDKVRAPGSPNIYRDYEKLYHSAIIRQYNQNGR